MSDNQHALFLQLKQSRKQTCYKKNIEISKFEMHLRKQDYTKEAFIFPDCFNIKKGRASLVCLILCRKPS
jgi:hypothetical protein